MKRWITRHALALSEATMRARRHPFGSLLNIIVLAIVLALPLFGTVLLEILKPLGDRLSVAPEISVFLAPDLPRNRAEGLGKDIAQVLAGTGLRAQTQFVPRESALDRMKKRPGIDDAVTAIGENPLPDAYVIRLPAGADTGASDAISKAVRALQSTPGVDAVQFDSEWVNRVAAFYQLLRRGLNGLAVAFSVVVLAVVFNTIRLQVLRHREVMRIALLMGATEQFVAAPFYYGGALLGLVSGLLAGGIVWATLIPVLEVLTPVLQQFNLSPETPASAAALGGAFLVLSTALGLVGAILPVRLQLARMLRN